MHSPRALSDAAYLLQGLLYPGHCREWCLCLLQRGGVLLQLLRFYFSCADKFSWFCLIRCKPARLSLNIGCMGCKHGMISTFAELFMLPACCATAGTVKNTGSHAAKVAGALGSVCECVQQLVSAVYGDITWPTPQLVVLCLESFESKR